MNINPLLIFSLLCGYCLSFNSFADNPHYADNDTWNVLFINETKDPINIHWSNQQLWDSSLIPDNVIIEPCSEYKSTSTYTLMYPYSQQTVQPGFLNYSLYGAYKGTLSLIGNTPAIDIMQLGAINGQAQSGSADWIGSKDMHICRKNEVYNCIQTGFYRPKNIATFPSNTDTSQFLRQASTHISSTNEAFVVFEPRNTDDVCPLRMSALYAWVTQQLPAMITSHKDDIDYPNQQSATLAQLHPDWNFNYISGGIYTTGWGLDKKGAFPLLQMDTGHPILQPKGDGRNMKTQKIYSSQSNLKNTSTVIQNMSTNSFSRSEAVTNTTTTTVGWSAEVSMTFKGSIPIFGGIDTTIGIKGGWSQGDSHTCTYSRTDTVTAPAQTVMVPKHTEAVATWVLEKISGDQDFTFSAPIINQKLVPVHLAGLMVKNADEWHHPGSLQQHQDAQILDEDLTFVDLYWLISPTKTAGLPPEITRQDDGTLLMYGAGSLQGEALGRLEVEVEEYDLDEQGNRIPGVPPIVEHYPVTPDIKPDHLRSSENPCN